MSYLVLARKWRPRNFSEVAGQEHVLRALINALDNDRLHHAFLFSGTRGVGKTTLARIFAKSINCERGVSSTPCGVCSACVEIDEGRYVDLLEVDAASRTRVDDTRELLDNVQYAPTRGRYKVYLIDEVHMLSTHSFNALLKTLEEPPAHVKFLLATTDPQKLPVTVLSRCLQFNLKRLPPPVIEGQLKRIAEAEGYAHEAAALGLLADGADGSMRDALSLLDQAIAHAGGDLTREAVVDMLGTVDRTHVFRLLEALAEGNGSALLGIASDLAERGLGADSVLSELATACQQLALAQVVPDALEERVADAQAVRTLAEQAAADSVQLWYQIAVNGRRDLPLAPTPWIGLEMTLLRMLAFQVEDGEGGGGTGGAPGSPEKGGGSSKGAKKAAGAGGRGPKAPGGNASAAASESTGASVSANVPKVAPNHQRARIEAAAPRESESREASPAQPSAARSAEVSPSRPVPAATDPAPSMAPDPVQVMAPERAVGMAPGPEIAAAPAGPGPRAVAPPETVPGAGPELAPAEVAAPNTSGADAPAVAQTLGQEDWERFAESLGASGMLRQLADNSVLMRVEGKALRLQLDEAREHLLTRQQCAAMEQAWCAMHGAGWRLDFAVGCPQVQTAAQRAELARSERQQQAVRSMREDPYVQALQQTFGAELLEDTVQVRSGARASLRAPQAPQGDEVREAGGRR